MKSTWVILGFQDGNSWFWTKIAKKFNKVNIRNRNLRKSDKKCICKKKCRKSPDPPKKNWSRNYYSLVCVQIFRAIRANSKFSYLAIFLWFFFGFFLNKLITLFNFFGIFRDKISKSQNDPPRLHRSLWKKFLANSTIELVPYRFSSRSEIGNHIMTRFYWKTCSNYESFGTIFTCNSF